jgi:histidinol-phosphatase
VSPMSDDLVLAHELADLADGITLARWRAHDLRVETKPDMTPVSEADRAVETALRRHIAAVRPGDAVLGEEEGGATGAAGGRRWILDPIDGTRNYVRGLPVFATLVALEVDGRIETGVVSAPALHRRWWASRGGGAHSDVGPLHVSAVRAISDAYISNTDPRFMEQPGLRHAYAALARRCWTARGLGDFWMHVLVAEGSIDIAVEVGAKLWDWAPLWVIVEEAGGRFTDLDGTPRADGAAAVASNGLLHDEVLAALRVEPSP